MLTGMELDTGSSKKMSLWFVPWEPEEGGESQHSRQRTNSLHRETCLTITFEACFHKIINTMGKAVWTSRSLGGDELMIPTSF